MSNTKFNLDKFLREHAMHIATGTTILIIIIFRVLGKDVDNYKLVVDLMVYALIAEIAITIFWMKKDVDTMKDWANSKNNLENEIDNILNRIDPDFKKLLNSNLTKEKNYLIEAIQENEITIYSREEFLNAYKTIFELFPKTTFIGTSLPYKSYFWTAKGDLPDIEHDTIENATRSFITNGGKITRYFYIDGNLLSDSANSKHIHSVLEYQQVALGVDVHVTRQPNDLIASNGKEKDYLFFYSEEMNLGWTAYINDEYKLTGFTFTKNKKRIQKYKSTIESIKVHERKWETGKKLVDVLSIQV